jgi:hypothetical protein
VLSGLGWVYNGVSLVARRGDGSKLYTSCVFASSETFALWCLGWGGAGFGFGIRLFLSNEVCCEFAFWGEVCHACMMFGWGCDVHVDGYVY